MASQPQPIYRINLRWFRIFYWPLLLPVALLLALFNKVSPVPFKIYVLRVDRVGQMAGNQEEIMCEFDLGLRPREYRVFVHRDRPSNSVLMDMQKRVLPIYQIFLPLFDVCHKLGGLGVSSMELAGISGFDALQLTSKTKQHLDFTPGEIEQAERECRELGIDPHKPFIPVLSRDASYLKSLQEPTDNDSYRNVDINTFVPAMEYLADRFQVMRVGSVVNSTMNTTHKGIFDYSLSGKRSDLLDVFFSAKCHFFFSCGTGLDSITSCCFRKPVLYVNFTPVSVLPILKPWTLLIPKKYWHLDEQRYLRLSELLETGIADLYTPRALNPHRVVIHDNTPEEVLEAAKEMEARLDGTWVETEEAREMQAKFWSFYRNQSSDHVCVGRIGTHFLKNNPNWLE